MVKEETKVWDNLKVISIPTKLYFNLEEMTYSFKLILNNVAII